MSRVFPILFNTDMVRAILDGRKTVTRRAVKPRYKKNEYGFEVATNKATGQRWVNAVDDEGFIRREILPPCKPRDILYVRETWCWEPCWDCGMDTEEHNCGDKSAKKFFNHDKGEWGCYGYKASLEDNVYPSVDVWHPSIHMPKEAARIWLKVTDVRVERLQEITDEQAEKEGISRLYDDLPDEEYEDWTKRTGIYPKQKIEWGYKNYLWHGNFGNYGTGNWKSDRWDYQYSSYENAVGSFSSMWNSALKKSELDRYGWDANPWVWVIEFERCEKSKGELCEEK